jgi:uncharacterized damage-inducible protein DinB
LPTPVDLAQSLRIQARANRLANHRLHGAMAALAPAELHAPRTSFFPTLMQTLNHILDVDLYYIGSMHGERDLRLRLFVERVPHETLAPLAAEQVRSDERLIAFCDTLNPLALNEEVAMDRGPQGVQRELVAHVLAHLFMHQTHHRGQVHAMLSGTSVKPPQLDEFLMPTDAKFRVEDMATLGWRESDVYGVVAHPWA